MTKLVLKVKGMHCASCSILIDKLLKKQDGVINSSTSYGAQKVALEFDESKISLEKIDEFVNTCALPVLQNVQSCVRQRQKMWLQFCYYCCEGSLSNFCRL